MSTTTNKNDELEVFGSSDRRKFVTTARLEISQILHAIMRRSTQITVNVDDPDDFFLTSILALDERGDYIIFECGPHPHQNQRVLARQALGCTTRLDKIRIEFECDRIEAVSHEGRDAFKTAFPRELLRLQRREYYRMATPILAPVTCTISPLNPDGKDPVELNLFDISCGGLGVVTPPTKFRPDLGERYECTTALPEGGVLREIVEARNAFLLTLPNGNVTQRTGFAFVDPSEYTLSTIQRYIMNLERSRFGKTKKAGKQ